MEIFRKIFEKFSETTQFFKKLAKKIKKRTVPLFFTERKKRKKIYGMELVLTLSDCNLKYLASRKKIQEFINKICKKIKMEKYGPSYIQRFPGGKLWGVGYSFFQFITTSSITGHFIEPDRLAFINIFSCNMFDSKKAGRFAKNFFQAKKIKNRLIIH